MIFSKQALLALGVACAACPFSHASKGGKNPPNSKAHKESTPFFVASAACAQKCISAEFGPDRNAIQQCDAKSSNQMWHIVSDGTSVKVKSVGASADWTNGGWCLGVVPQVAGSLGSSTYLDDDNYRNPGDGWSDHDRSLGAVSQVDGALGTQMDDDSRGTVIFLDQDGDTENALFLDQDGDTDELLFPGDGNEDHDMCSNGSKLGLVSCDHPTSQWSSTDGQLISQYCWGIGLSSFLSVNEECTDLHLSTTLDGATAISRKQTFMAVTQDFIETIHDDDGEEERDD